MREAFLPYAVARTMGGRVTVAVAASAPAPTTAARGRVRRTVTGRATPDRLRRVGAVLVVGCLLTALAGLLSGLSRTDQIADGGGRIAELTVDAAELYRSLADADAMATSGYVSGGIEPADVRARYDADLSMAADRIVAAASRLPADDPATVPVATLSKQLPVYSGLIETARTYNRQGLPLGQSYLNSGSTLMRTTMLPAAEELRRLQTASLDRAYDSGGAIPLVLLVFGVATLVAIVDVSVLERRRTRRVFNTGLVAAGAGITAALLWVLIAGFVTAGAIGDARQHSDAATALDAARAAVLQARSNESLVLVARGGGAADTGFTAQLTRVLGPDGLLTAAAAHGAPVDGIRAATQAWDGAHRALRELDNSGKYIEAVASATGATAGGSGTRFTELDDALSRTIAGEREAFRAAAVAASGATNGLAWVPAGLAVLAAAGVAVGIAGRVGEYR